MADAIGATTPYVREMLSKLPAYDGHRLYPAGQIRPFEFSQATKVTGDPLQWISEVNRARERTAEARTLLQQVKDAPIPSSPEQMSSSVRDAIWGARRMVGAGPNEVPRFGLDGAAIAEDAVRLGSWTDADRLVSQPPVYVHAENVLYRLPKDSVPEKAVQAVDDAARLTVSASNELSYSRSAAGRPDVKGALEMLDRMDSHLDDALSHAGSASVDAGRLHRLNNHLAQLTPGQSRLLVAGAIGGAVLAGGLIGWHLTRD